MEVLSMKTVIEWAGFKNSSCDDGPGMRSVLFLQGCSKNCEGCHNSKIKEHGKGISTEVETLLQRIDAHCCNKKITISGGEPLEQEQSLLVLLRRLKEKGYNTCIYTGWELEKVPKKILDYADYIKTGSFDKALINPAISYVGSANQHMYKIENGYLTEMNLII